MRIAALLVFGMSAILLPVGEIAILGSAAQSAIVSILLLLVHFDWRIYFAGGIALVASGAAYLARNLLRRRWR